MITITKIKAKNFLSYGNSPVEFDLATHKTTLIRGRNGHGKSAILDMVIYGLYGKPYRGITKPSLVNSINNNNLEVEIDFNINNNAYKVVRGIKPAVFDIFMNDVLIEQDAMARDYQEFLETQILKVREKTFKQIAVLGSASYVPFMQLPAAGRRDLIESILDIEVFSVMNGVLKDRMSQTKEESLGVDSAVLLKRSEAVAQQKLIDVINKNTQQQADELEKKKNAHKCAVAAFDKQIELLSNEIKALEEPHYDHAAKVATLAHIDDLKKAIKATKHTRDQLCNLEECPTCYREIDSSHAKSVDTFLVNKMLGDKSMIDHYTEQVSVLLAQALEYETYTKDRSALVTNMFDLQQQRNMAQKYLDEFSLDVAPQNDILLETDILKQIGADALVLLEKKNELATEKHLQEVSYQLLRDSGVKTAIVREYLPVLNKLINQYLNMFNFFIDFNLDESFNEVIRSRGRDIFSYENFSEGEKRRIDFSILMAFRAMAALKNSAKTNILIFDELLDSNLDLTGREVAHEIVTNIDGANVIVISHADASADNFSRVLQIDKVGDFSTCYVVE